MALTDFLTQIADSIRSKDGTTEPILATDFPQRIIDIPSGGGENVDICIDKITFSSDYQLGIGSYKFTHTLGKVPNFIMMYNTTINGGCFLSAYANTGNESDLRRCSTNNGNTMYSRTPEQAPYFKEITDESFRFGYASNFKLGGTYYIVTAVYDF